jgi:hypothetical protein
MSNLVAAFRDDRTGKVFTTGPAHDVSQLPLYVQRDLGRGLRGHFSQGFATQSGEWRRSGDYQETKLKVEGRNRRAGALRAERAVRRKSSGTGSGWDESKHPRNERGRWE